MKTVLEELRIKSIIKFIHYQTNWKPHAKRMNNNSQNTKTNDAYKPKGSRNLGRPEKTWHEPEKRQHCPITDKTMTSHEIKTTRVQQQITFNFKKETVPTFM
jgi:hypothetical protein